MSTKSKRGPTPQPGRQTPQPGRGASQAPAAPPAPVPQSRPTSPLSPTRHSRLVEKAELQNLNDRLATYIDRVRNLENENARLTAEVRTSQETITREVTSIKSMYEHELSDARKLVDETSREKAKLEIDTKRLWEECEDLKKRLDKKSKELTTAENSARLYESRYNDLSGKYSITSQDLKKAVEEKKALEKELDKLRKQFDELRKNLEDETLARVDLENTVQSLREELTFKDQIHSQEINESRSLRQVEITEIDGRLSEQYEAKLQQSLQELRDQYEAQMRANRDEIEGLYENKIKNLQSAANRNSNAATAANEELRATRIQIDQLNSSLNELEATKAALAARIRDLESLLNAERARHNADVDQLESELQRLRDEMQHQLQEYQDLMDIKVSLDLEIAAYDKLLRGEENRLNISPAQNPATAASLSQSFRSSRATPSRLSAGPVPKRKRIFEETESLQAEYFVTASAKGEIEIVEADPEGRFVKLHNKGDKEVALGGWQILRTAGTEDTSFKFHRSAKIAAGAVVTIWSADAGTSHDPPANIVMKQKKWVVGDDMKTNLLNAEGDNVAESERIKQVFSTRASRHRSTRGAGGEELYHQQGEPQGEEKCSIM